MAEFPEWKDDVFNLIKFLFSCELSPTSYDENIILHSNEKNKRGRSTAKIY